jgi:hypothetical protein
MDSAFGVVVEQGGGHLAAAGVVDTDEQDLGDLAHDGSLGLGEGAESLSGEAVDEQGMKSTTRAPDMRSIDSSTKRSIFACNLGSVARCRTSRLIH